MKPLPTVGADTGTWGTVLNTYLGELLPSGAMVQYGGAAAPAGWLLCDGTSYLRADYTDLFNALGGASSPWGLPDGTHFNVPDLRGRMPVGLGTNADVDTLAENDGATVADRRPKHKHTVTWAGVHQHTYTIGGVAGSDAAGTQTGDSVTVGPQTNSPTDGPAYVVVNYIIKT